MIVGNCYCCRQPVDEAEPLVVSFRFGDVIVRHIRCTDRLASKVRHHLEMGIPKTEAGRGWLELWNLARWCDGEKSEMWDFTTSRPGNSAAASAD